MMPIRGCFFECDKCDDEECPCRELTLLEVVFENPAWPADVFAVLCGGLEWQFPRMDDLGLFRECDPAGIERKVQEAGGRTPDVIWKYLNHGRQPQPEERITVHPCAAFMVTLAIDWALDMYSPDAEVQQRLQPFWDQLDRRGADGSNSLTTAPERLGWLLPVKPRNESPRGQFLANHYKNLRWIRPTPGQTIELERSWEKADLLAIHRVERSFVVGFLPCIEDADVKFKPYDRDGSTYYGVELADEAKVFERVCEAIEGNWYSVDMIVAPEAAFTVDLWERLRTYLRDKYLPGVRLKMLVLGTASYNGAGNTLAKNRACVISAQGDTLVEQDKMHRYHISPREIERYELEEYLPPEAGNRAEDAGIHPRRLVLYEDQDFGRMAILICEDFAHLEPAATAAIHLGVDLLICPAMDGELLLHRWAACWADWYARVFGVQSIVINSLVLPPRHRRRVGHGAPLPESPERYGVGLVARDGRGRVKIVGASQGGELRDESVTIPPPE
jgi:predicted amidohydrolase